MHKLVCKDAHASQPKSYIVLNLKLLDAVRAAFDADMAGLAAARATCVEYILDPIAACPGSPTVALVHANLTAAYITL